MRTAFIKCQANHFSWHSPIIRYSPWHIRNGHEQTSKNAPTHMQLDLSLASNLHGKLNAPIQDRLHRYFNNPTEEAWEDVHGIILNQESMMTVWQAMLELDPSFPRRGPSEELDGAQVRGWERIPTADEFSQAINFAIR